MRGGTGAVIGVVEFRPISGKVARRIPRKAYFATLTEPARLLAAAG
jgi:hypothetical protein